MEQRTQGHRPTSARGSRHRWGRIHLVLALLGGAIGLSIGATAAPPVATRRTSPSIDTAPDPVVEDATVDPDDEKWGALGAEMPGLTIVDSGRSASS